MASTAPQLPQMEPSRAQFLKTVAPQLTPLLDSANGRTPEVAITTEQIDKLKLANSVAELADHHPDITGGILADAEVSTLRDVANKYSSEKLAALIKSNEPAKENGQHLPEIVSFQRKVFHREPSAFVARMVKDDQIPIGHTISEPDAGSQNRVAMAAVASSSSSAAAAAAAEPKPQNAVKDGVLKFFENNASFNIRDTSIVRLVSNTKAMDGIPEDVKPDVIHSLKMLQTTQALSHTPEAIPGLMKSKMTTAQRVSQVSETDFVKNFAEVVGGEENARSIHTHATNVVIRNDLALTNILQTVRGTGISMIDSKGQTRAQRLTAMKDVAKQLPQQIDLEQLFGQLEVCACDDCNSVTSPAAYFVELLQYLRNNNLDPLMAASGDSGYEGTPLEVLLRRRPDLADLELTCANTNTVLPYIDLANEVMESFVIHLPDFAAASGSDFKLDVFNADRNTDGLGGSSAEMLAQPQNTNDQAYCILSQAVYPSVKLPFHQPVEAVRLFLEFLQTGRAELQSIFQKPYNPPTVTIPDPSASDNDCSTPSSSSDSSSAGCPCNNCGPCLEGRPCVRQRSQMISKPISADGRSKLSDLHSLALSRADDAERLLLTEEEYIILTKQAFWTKEYFDIRHGTTTKTSVYQQRIGVKPIYDYWGVDYHSVDDMLNQDEDDPNMKGLTLVKAQFLPRSGIKYADLVDLLKTDFINPNMPKGRDSVILKSFRLTYRFLQTLVQSSHHQHGFARFKPVADFILDPRWRKALAAQNLPDPVELFEQDDFDTSVEASQPAHGCGCCSPVPERRRRDCHPCRCQCHVRYRILLWLCQNFDKLGKIIVLESKLQSDLIMYEYIILREGDGSEVGRLAKDGKIYNVAPNSREVIGALKLDGSLVAVDDTNGQEVSWHTKFGNTVLSLEGEKIGTIDERSTVATFGDYVDGQGRLTRVKMAVGDLFDDCDLGKDRLRHLDGTPLCAEDYDRIHRFIRLWRKLGWSMIELDVSLNVLSKKTPPLAPTAPCGVCTGDCQCPATPAPVELYTDDVDWADFASSCANGQCNKSSCISCTKLKYPKTKCDKDEECMGDDNCTCEYHRCRRHRSHCCCRICSVTQPKNEPEITPEFLHELVSVKKLVDLTGLPLLNLLAFWGPISTSGSPSLYSQLFLTHNLRGIDQVFVADKNENYLAASPAEKIEKHIHILLAAFNLKVPVFSALREKLSPDLGEDLTITAVSFIYRYVTMGRILAVKPDLLKDLFDVLQINPFTSAAAAVQLVELWNTVSDAGFTFQQLRYVLTGRDDNLQPIGPSPRTMLQTAMTLYTGLNDIEEQHKDITTEAPASVTVLTNLQLLFSGDVAAQIAGFLDGTYTFTVRGPQGLTIVIPPGEKAFASKLKYADGIAPTVQSTGQLTEEEVAKAKALSASPQWAAAIDRLAKNAATFLRKTLAGIFPPEAEAAAKQTLLVGDIVPAATDGNPEAVATAPKKRAFFLKYFIPYLRRKLADKLVIDTIASATSLDPLIAGDLVSNIITMSASSNGQNTAQTALEALKKIREDAAPSDGFSGYLIADSTDQYTLIGQSDSQPSDIILDSYAIPLSEHDPDDEPSDLWSSKPLRLIGGRLYSIKLTGLKPADLKWKTDVTQVTTVPSSALLGDHVKDALKDIFVLLYKCAIIINNFGLDTDEVMHLHTHSADFGALNEVNHTVTPFDWNVPSLSQWRRLADYTKLKKSLPKLGKPLLDLFKWMYGAEGLSADAVTLGSRIEEFTLWDKNDVATLIDSKHFDLAKAMNFRNEIALLKIEKAIQVRNKVGVDIDLLFQWAFPRVSFWKLRDMRESIRVAIRSQFKLSDWEVAIKPTYDKLRQLQSDALTAYLISQPAVIENGVVDIINADSLFEFLLIDNQMCPCMETARLKQATSSVQLFVQRCMLGLETDVDQEKLDRGRWEWMQRFRVWQANRLVYLYPENWIEPSLRDDKSPLYIQLEGELHQKDLDSSSVLEAIKNFLHNLDEIANLEVAAVYVEDGNQGQTKPVTPNRLHIFAKTRGAPYKFYYRMYNLDENTWQPWQDMTVDIPRYEVEKPKKTTAPAGGPDTPGPAIRKSGGSYLVPFTYNSRLIVAIPQFQKIQAPAPVPKRKMADIGNNMDADESDPDEFWEIKIGLSELRHGKWTPKQITSESITEKPRSLPPFRPMTVPPIGAYKFIPRADETLGLVHIDVYRLDIDANTTDPLAQWPVLPVGRFTFNGRHVGVSPESPRDLTGAYMAWSDFHFQGERADDPERSTETKQNRVMYPIQGTKTDDSEHATSAYVKYPFDDTAVVSMIKYDDKPKEEAFYHSFAHELLNRTWRTDSLDDFFDYIATKVVGDENVDDAFGRAQEVASPTKFNELYRPYSLYNWEMGFHAPMAIVDRLVQNQQFDLALKMIHYVFDPLAKGTDESRYWKWPPFREDQSLKRVVDLFKNLEPNTTETKVGDPKGPINTWRDNPFQPHVVARLRPIAYMKFVVMKYISILIAYGDYYFRQNTLETIPFAIQCYVLASHIYGPAPQVIPKRGTKQVQSYRTLLDKWDTFSNAMVQMEVLFPFSINQIPAAVGQTKNGVVGLANIFGFAATQYFCIPDNPRLKEIRDTIDDRLFKIRHCQDIKGVERKLPLYEPPIDPGLLVAAQAAGLSLSSVINDLNAPLPNFRFKKLLKRALEMCKRLKELGSALVVAKERQDYESMIALKQTHENAVHQLTMEQKKTSRDEAAKSVEHLQQSRKAPEYRMKHNLQQLGEDLGSIPTVADIESEFKELASNIEAPVVESGMKLISAEKEDLAKLAKSLNLQPIINSIESTASELMALPVFNTHASPFGVGLATCLGPPNVGKMMQGAAKAYQIVTSVLGQESAKIAKMQHFSRTNQARVKEANSTGHEIKTIDKSIATQQIRVAVHDADIAAHDKAITNAQEVHEFLTSKYTNTELYTWLDQQMSDLYYSTYTATYDLARKAEAAFRYERGLPDTKDPPPIIKFGYWDAQRSGLLCADRLLLDLNALDAAYQESRGHDFEVTKHISLRAVNPLQLFRLRGDATADFAVPEILFDMDFPGHYGRRIKSVALSIRSRPGSEPAPFDNVNCTLRLTAHKFRSSGIVKGSTDYPEKTDQDDDRFTSTSYVPIEAIATSSPTRDAGVFHLDFSERSERFLPFEGAGAISTWRLELNPAFRNFDYGAIDDVVLSMQYTALDGGMRLRSAATDAVTAYIKTVTDLGENEGLYGVFDVRRDFPAAWAAATSDTSATSHKLDLKGINTRLPAYARTHAPDRIQSRDVWILTDRQVAPGSVSLRQGGTTMVFSRADGVVGRGDAALKALHSTDGPVALRDWVVEVGGSLGEIEEFWILVRYLLKP